MAKCPNCKAEIEQLDNWQSGEAKYTFDGETYEELSVFAGDDKTNEYECPECNIVLFTDDAEAKKFLTKEV